MISIPSQSALNRSATNLTTAQKKRRRRLPKLALDEEKVHRTPEEDDGNANRLFGSHAVKHSYAKGKGKPIQIK